MSKHITPQEAANRFIIAVIKNDIDEIGRFSGMSTENGLTPSEQFFGKLLADAIRFENQRHPRDLEKYKWQLGKCRENGNVCDMQVEIYTPDEATIARKAGIYMGDKMGSDGVLQMADPPLMTEEEAEAKASKETPPLHYRVPLMVERQGEEWHIAVPNEEYTAIMDVINKGDILTKNEKYRVK